MKRFALVALATCGLGFAALINAAARADERMIPLALSGDWSAVEHHNSMSEPPDFCFAFTSASGQMFGVRASMNDIEVRFSDDSWSLPPDISGTLVVDVGAYNAALDITGNTNDMVIAVVAKDQLQSLIAAMDKADSMTVSAGKAPPTTISLNGSNTATTAFLTCAGITAPGEGGGGNPFQ
jgi:hypothetical protein